MQDTPKIVLGLGNPGERYRGTRHNLGQRAVERFAVSRGVRLTDKEPARGNAVSAELEISGERALLAVPTSYMNRSGRAALALLATCQAEPSELLVVYDDADLDLGRLRLRRGGGAGGHNGIRSIIDALRTEEFPRLRLGVRGAGRAESDLADYVLESFDPGERDTVERLLDLAADVIEVVLQEGLEPAMNRFSGKGALPE